MTSPDTVVRRRTPNAPVFELFATTGAGLEKVLLGEVKRLGARNAVAAQRGVSFAGDLETIYKANLWLRTAHRVLLKIAEFDASDRKRLYEGARDVRWSDYLPAEGTIAVDAVSHASRLNHTQFIAQVVKDAIVDLLRDRTGRRPDVDRKNPDFRVNARLLGDRCTLSIDTSGDRLHRRGYRPSFGFEAPLMETLAAGIVMLCGYDGSRELVDPMCGSGTLLVEAALVARNIAPGLLGRDFGFMRLPSYDQSLWKEIVSLAKADMRKNPGCSVFGSDISAESLRAARASAFGAGVDDIIRLRRADIKDLKEHPHGMMITNPPYGERLGEVEMLAGLYETLGGVLKKSCSGMTAHILTSSKFLAQKIGLKSYHMDILYNGGIECGLLHYEIY
jgi:putative N6-adenine-specific DNA methylase